MKTDVQIRSSVFTVAVVLSDERGTFAAAAVLRNDRWIVTAFPGPVVEALATQGSSFAAAHELNLLLWHRALRHTREQAEAANLASIAGGL